MGGGGMALVQKYAAALNEFKLNVFYLKGSCPSNSFAFVATVCCLDLLLIFEELCLNAVLAKWS